MKNIRLHLTTTQRLPLNIFGHHIQPVQGKQERSVDARYILTECVNAKKENLENSPYDLLIELIIQILWSKIHLSSQLCLILLTQLELVQDTTNFLLLGNGALWGSWSLSSHHSSHSFIRSFNKYLLSALYVPGIRRG